MLACRNLPRAAQLSPTTAIACQGRFRGTPIVILVVFLEVAVYLHVGRGPSTRLKGRNSLLRGNQAGLGVHIWLHGHSSGRPAEIVRRPTCSISPRGKSPQSILNPGEQAPNAQNWLLGVKRSSRSFQVCFKKVS